MCPKSCEPEGLCGLKPRFKLLILLFLPPNETQPMGSAVCRILYRREHSDLSGLECVCGCQAVCVCVFVFEGSPLKAGEATQSRGPVVFAPLVSGSLQTIGFHTTCD